MSRRLETRRVLPINNPGEFPLKRSAIAACAAPTHVDPRLLRTIRGNVDLLAPFIRRPAGRRGDRYGRAPRFRGLAGARPDARILRADPGGGCDLHRSRDADRPRWTGRRCCRPSWSTSPRCCCSARTRRCSSSPLAPVARGLTDPSHAHPVRRMLMNAAAVLMATHAAGLAHRALGGTTEHFTWPEQGFRSRVPLSRTAWSGPSWRMSSCRSSRDSGSIDSG